MPPPIVLTFFTDERYKREADRLICTAVRHGGLRLRGPSDPDGNLVVVELPDSGHWGLNNQKKATLVREWLLRTNAPVMWVDADSIIHRNPIDEILHIPSAAGCDIAYPLYPDPKTGDLRLFASTLWFAPTALVNLIPKWISLLPAEARMRNAPEFDLGVSEQTALETAVHSLAAEGRIRPYQLPPEFACIYDVHPYTHPGIVPHITAFQYSRIARETKR